MKLAISALSSVRAAFVPRRFVTLLLSGAGALILSSAGCNWNAEDQRERDAKTRDEVAKATERAKPVIEDASRKLGKVAHEAADQARAAAEGVREGWKNGQHPLVNVNSATENQLLDLPGVNRPGARRIIAGRPYRDRHDLVSTGILSAAEYDKIRDYITAK